MKLATTTSVALALAIVGGCANGSSSKETKMPIPAPGKMIRAAAVPLDSEIWTPCEVDGAGRWVACQQLVASGGGAVVADLLATPVTAAVVAARVAEGAPVLITETDLRAVGSEQPFPLDQGLREASWAAPTSSAAYVRIAERRGGPDTAIELYDASTGAQRWRVARDRLDGYPMGIGVAPDGSTVVLLLRPLDGGDAVTLVALAGTDGSERWRHRLDDTGLSTPTPILFAPDGKELILLFRKEGDYKKGEETTGQLVAYTASDGAELRRVVLPATGTAFRGKLGDDMSAGYDGEVAWFYQYRPSRPASHSPVGPGRTIDESCSYEVYDAAKARPTAVRSGADATGELAELLSGCGVMAMRSLAGSSVAVIGVPAHGQLTVSIFDGPP